MIHIHDLKGCSPAPLAHYLKALAVLRLIAEQADLQARGWWEGERFRIATILSQEELEAFFLLQYEPTPMVAPWNGGTGFYPKDKTAKGTIQGLLSHTSVRFDPYKRAIKAAQDLVGTRKEVPEKKDKEEFLSQCKFMWRGGHRDAMDAAVVLDSKNKPAYPALLGSGFNDGRLDFTSNFMGRLLRLFPANGEPAPITASLLGDALWKHSSLGMMAKGAIGQFLPGDAGGANSSNAPDGVAISNPWDFILMLEGAMLFKANATRRMGTTQSSRAAAPFAVGAQGAGYASSSAMDESARGEQWMPLWSQPMKLDELKHLLGEGRAQLGARSVKEPLDLARAVAQFGTTRGIVAFQRYGYIERNGQANLAVPLGRFLVPEKIIPQLACLDDLDAWFSRLRFTVRDKNASVRFHLVERQLSDALFAVAQHPKEPSRWQSILLALSEVDAVILTGKESNCGTCPRLRPDWVPAADDGSPEFRLAVAFALQWDEKPFGSIRRHWIPGKNDETAAVMKGRNGIDDAIALVKRRLIESSQNGQRRLTLRPQIRASAEPHDITSLLTGGVDIDRTIALARALMALDARQWLSNPRPPQKAQGKDYPDDAWLVIRLATLPWPLPDGRNIGTDPAILRRLESGDAAEAFELALRRLRAVGITTTVRCAVVTAEMAHLWAAALAFPITQHVAEKFVHRLDPNIN